MRARPGLCQGTHPCPHALKLPEGSMPLPVLISTPVQGTSRARPSFQGTSTVSNDEVLARLLSRMDVFDTRLTGMESMIADRFQLIEIMHDSLDSRLDTI
ncbi:hypothetical protein JCGZ_06584 [Jatropha curcas]|uniref:Uncharacterized protein n=1 Tax=Jatropha curcas TaxID=180498 RepID=A0A067LFN3_JATCU|nr:hypothetical protein JCGZ_06584 [Jatropha curcas]